MNVENNSTQRLVSNQSIPAYIHGTWFYSSTDDKLHCSECFSEAPTNGGDILLSDVNYCYKCGAKLTIIGNVTSSEAYK